MDFENAAILITGAASGIGAAAARLLAERGAAELLLCDLDGERLQAAAAALPCRTRLLVGDVADEQFWAGADLCRLSHALVNAGIAYGNTIAATSFADWRRVLSANLDGAFLSLQAAMAAMADGGAIVLTSSASALKAHAGTAAYGASKAGLLQLMRVAALEGAANNIRVNAIAPGGVRTPIWHGAPGFAELMAAAGEDAAFAEFEKAGLPIARFATPEEIAGQIAFLLSDAAAFSTGSVLVSDGGYTL